MKNNVYIAGSWKNRIVIKQLMKDIESWGYKITVDWTEHKRKENIMEYAQEYLKGLKECDYFVYCMDGIKSIGKNFELGYATALDKHVGVYVFDNNIFGPNLKNVSFDKIVDKECIFIRANMYQVLHTLDELKNWLPSIT